MQGAREREVAAIALEVLSLSSGDTRRLTWNILEVVTRGGLTGIF